QTTLKTPLCGDLPARRRVKFPGAESSKANFPRFDADCSRPKLVRWRPLDGGNTLPLATLRQVRPTRPESQKRARESDRFGSPVAIERLSNAKAPFLHPTHGARDAQAPTQVKRSATAKSTDDRCGSSIRPRVTAVPATELNSARPQPPPSITQK